MPDRTAQTPWLTVRNRRPEARIRLFCFPFAGGGASIYRDWLNEMPPYIEIAPVQLPGRENRFAEELARDFEDLIQRITAAVRPFTAEMPFALFGHSLGALLAFETARRLARFDAPSPSHVIVSAHSAPHFRPKRQSAAHLTDDQVRDWLRQQNGTSEDILENSELMDLLLPVLRADLQVEESYQPTSDAVVSCPLTAIASHQDGDAPPDQVSAWERHTRNRFTFRIVDGNHFFAFNESRAAVLAAIVDALTLEL
jgi:medium-chain acyl-[acyl-carrier-protein] hydrolase